MSSQNQSLISSGAAADYAPALNIAPRQGRSSAFEALVLRRVWRCACSVDRNGCFSLWVGGIVGTRPGTFWRMVGFIVTAGILSVVLAARPGRHDNECNATSFNTTTATQPMSLQAYALASTQAECVAACCADDSCSTWAWESSDPSQSKCWIGEGTGSVHNPLWTAGFRPVPPPSPPPFELPRITPLPANVTGIQHPVVDLGGQWQFNPGAPGTPPDNWTTINVPGEYTLQGFRVVNDSSAVVYSRTFSLDDDWTAALRKGLSSANSSDFNDSLRVKIRFDGVYSLASVRRVCCRGCARD